MPEKIIETEAYILKFHADNYLECYMKPDVLVDEERLLEGKRIIEEQRPGGKYFVYSEGAGFFTLTRKARELSATAEYSTHLAAVAFVTNNVSLLLLSELHAKITKPVIPTRTFRKPEDAKNWLRSLMNKSSGAAT